MRNVFRCQPLGYALVCLLAAPLAVTAQTSTAKPAAAQAPAKKGAAAPAKPSPDAGPIVVVETVKGTFEFETYPGDAPKSVEHILALVKRNFYNGQRVHRVEPGFVVQFGDPKTRDMTKRDSWGQTAGGGSGKPIGVAEISKTHLHTKGAVGLAHAGDAAQGDSQIYVMLGDRPALNGKYAVIGRVLSGMDVVQKLQVEDIIKKVSIRQ
jgi:cyclophilin family peptidyl-prolyl cis-trans isomerase